MKKFKIDSVLTCNDVTCANGGTCTNIQTTSPDALDGFQCNCVNGFSGYLCETGNYQIFQISFINSVYHF